MSHIEPQKTTLFAMFVVMLAFILGSCNSASASPLIQADLPRQTIDVPREEVDMLIEGNNAFALDLYHKVSTGDENLLFSPYSLSQALAMVYGGAGGETAAQMAQALHFGLPQERLHPAFNALDLDLSNRANAPAVQDDGNKTVDDPFELNIANSIWGQKDASFRQEYLDLLAGSYGAGLRLADFERNPDVAVEQINRWASKATKGRIPQILDELDPETVLVLANAIYFNAIWSVPFDEAQTKPESFHLLDNSQETVPLMHQTASFDYAEGPGYQAIDLYYADTTFGMLVLLPAEGRFEQFEQELTPGRLEEIVSGTSWRKVILTLPKFRLETSLSDLSDILSGMGMPLAFSKQADFSGISQETRLLISQVFHKAFIDVSEKRTEAAAATIVEVWPVSEGYTPPPPVEMRIDRPFIFLIRDRQTGSILFVGRVMDPSQ